MAKESEGVPSTNHVNETPNSRSGINSRAWDDSGADSPDDLALRGEPMRLFIPNASVDNVGLVTDAVAAGSTIVLGDLRLVAKESIPARHKIAIRNIAEGEPVYKLGYPIGYAIRSIPAGAHVHDHNVGLICSDPSRSAMPSSPCPVDTGVWRSPAAPTRDHFLGYRRTDGRAATRNYIGIVPSVNCSATVARLIAQAANDRYSDVPALDGVVAMSHELGCAMAAGSEGDLILQRTLNGYASHPNFAAVLVVALGCEVNQPERFLTGQAAEVAHIGIQESGGTQATIEAALKWLDGAVGKLERDRRVAVPLSEVILGLQCGGSDAASGLTANPTLGVASDLLVAAGGTVILGETPEIYGAEHLLTERAASSSVADAIRGLIAWWQEYTASHGAVLDNNPSHGNREGGITTIWEKSLGAVLKGGTSPLRSVVGYAEEVVRPGLVFMDTPGYDPVSAAGMIAGGANILAFTTGRGSVYGSRPVPCLKISSTTELYERMSGDIDFNAGGALTREAQLEHGVLLFEQIVDSASGSPTKSESLGFGAEEITPWKLGAVL